MAQCGGQPVITALQFKKKILPITLLLFHVNFPNGINTNVSVIMKGMTLTSHTLIYHCLIYLHQTIFQKTFFKSVSNSLYEQIKKNQKIFYYRRKFQNGL